MRTIKTISLLLVIVGALNWMLVGFFGFDLVAAVTGSSFGERNVISAIVYVLVGIAGLVLVPNLFGRDQATAVPQRAR